MLTELLSIAQGAMGVHSYLSGLKTGKKIDEILVQFDALHRKVDQVEKLCERICLINKGHKVLEGLLSEIKMQFSKNVITLRYSGDERMLADHAGVERINSFGQELALTLKPGTDTNDVLSHAIDHGQVDRFEIGEMSLHDIFIAQVRAEGGEVEDEAAQGR